MKISKKGLDLIKRFEGFRSEPYFCPAGVATIGYGTTRYPDGTAVKIDDPPIDEAQAEQFLSAAVSRFGKVVEDNVTKLINQNQFDALVSFAYNLGEENLKRSTLLKKVNIKPDDKSIADEFMRWVHAGGKELKGLVRRRKREAELYLS